MTQNGKEWNILIGCGAGWLVGWMTKYVISESVICMWKGHRQEYNVYDEGGLWWKYVGKRRAKKKKQKLLQ